MACADGVGPGSHLPTTVRVRVTVPAATPAVWTPIGETLHVAVRRAGRVEPIVDTVLRVDSLTAVLKVPLAYGVERFVATAELRYAGVVLFLGFEALQLTAGGDTAVTLATTYVGPGARAATFTLGARDSTLAPGDTASLLPVVRDSAALVIPNALARYVTSQPSAFTVTGGIVTAQSGASDSARITGFLPTGQSSGLVVRSATGSPLPGTRTWVGGAAGDPTDWSTAANWNPPGVPGSQDTVVVVATDGGVGPGNDPRLSTSAAVGRLRIRGGHLTLNGHTLTVGGDFSTEDGAGTIAMQQPGDTLRVLGSAVFQGGLTRDLLTDGVLFVRGDFEQRNFVENHGSFEATENHHTILNGAATQYVRPEGDLQFGHLELANTSGQVIAQYDADFEENEIEVEGKLRFSTAVVFDAGDLTVDIEDSLIISANSRLESGTLRLSGGMRVAGTLMADTVEFAGDDQEIQADIAYQHVRVTDGPRLAGTTVFAGSLVISNDGRLDLNGYALTVSSLDVGAGTFEGSLLMMRPGSQLTVLGDATFDGDTLPDLLTEGELRVAGTLSVGRGSRRHALRAGGNHRTILNGSGLQVARFDGRATFGHLDVATAAGGRVEVALTDEVVQFTVLGKLRMTTPVSLGGDPAITYHYVSIDVADSLVMVPGSALYLGGLTLRGGLALNGLVEASQIEFAGTNQAVPAGIDYQHVTISGSAHLTGPTTFRGFALVRGPLANLALNGRKLTSLGPFTVGGFGEAQGTLTMTSDADSLVVSDDLSFAGASSEGRLTAGTVIASGGFFGGEDPAAFRPSGTHRVVMNGAAQQRIYFDQPGPAASRFNHLVLANTDVGFWLESPVYVAGELSTAGPAQMVSGNSHHLLTAAGVDLRQLTLDSIPLAMGGGAIARFDTVTFQRQNRGAIQLGVTHAGAATPFRFNGVRFLSPPTTGVYVAATDAAPADGATLTIELDGSFPADGSSHTTTSGGAVVNWTGGTPPASFSQMAAGVTFSCGVTTANVAYCWGVNTSGQLGDGTTSSRSVPTAVQGGLAFNGITAGGQHACGITPSGAIYCWGSNAYGQLGDNTTTDRLTPTPIASGLEFTSVTAGDQFTCALATNQLAYCWGRNGFGQLGDLTTTDRSSPTAVDGNVPFNVLVAGTNHACGVSNDAGYCWGSNTNGQLGDGTTTNSATPVLVGGSLGGFSFRRISPGSEHTCAVATDNRAYCWGWNNYGEIGDGTSTRRLTPTAVSGSTLYSSISAGGNGYTCGLSTTGLAYCWGLNNVGQLGDGTTTAHTTPAPVSGGLTLGALYAGFAHVLASAGAGASYAWGSNNQGQLGDGTTALRSTPVLILTPTSP